MVRIFNTIQIDRPVKEVFEYMTTPGNWQKWHPSVLGVAGTTDHSLQIGEQVTEEFLDAGQRKHIVWTVIERVELRQWAIEGKTLERNNAGRVTYIFKQTSNGVLFERENIYTVPNFFLAFYDWLIIRDRKKAEAKNALQKLKEHLEKM